MPVLLWILLWPLAEIAAFAMVGDALGALNTVLLVIVSGVAGLAILRRQGLAALMTARTAGPPTAGKLLDGLAVALAGLLLLLPGFLSDAVALALLIPGVRQGLGALLARQIVRSGGAFRFRAGSGGQAAGHGPGHGPGFAPGGGGSAGDPGVIDVDFTEVAAEPAPPERRIENRRS